jgi:hypothetical protein
MDVSPGQPMIGRFLRSFTRLDLSTDLAMVCVLFGWFFMNTLVVSLGSIEHGLRFFDMSAAIGDPTRLFFGVDWSFQRVLFAFICVLCILAPLAPQFAKNRLAWLAWLAPLVLILLCGLLLYSRTSGEFVTAPGDANALSGHLIQFANDMARRGSTLASRHVSVGAGGYLALIGAVVLAVQGVRRFHASR